MIGLDLCLISSSYRRRSTGYDHARPPLLVAVALAAFLYTAAAQAHGIRPGVRSAAPSSAGLSGALQQDTGLAPSQVAAQDICPAVGPGYARCDGKALVLRSSHALVRPHHRRHATLGRVKPGLVPGFVQPATAASAVAPPAAGSPAYLQQAYDLARISRSPAASATRSQSSTHSTTRPPSRTSGPTARPTDCPPARLPTAASRKSTSSATRRRCLGPTPAGPKRSRSISTRSRRCVRTVTSFWSRPGRAARSISLGRCRKPRRWAPTRSRRAGPPSPAIRSRAPTRSRAFRSSPRPATPATPAPARTSIRRRLAASPPPAARRSPRRPAATLAASAKALGR